MQKQLTVTKRPITEAGSVILALGGRFDFTSQRDFSHAVQGALANCDAKEIVLDLANIQYMDSAGIGMLLLAYQWSDKQNASFKVENVCGVPRKLLEISRLGEIFDIEFA